MKKETRVWALLDTDSQRKLQEYQLGHGFYYEPGLRFFLKKKDAIDAVESGKAIVPVYIRFDLNEAETYESEDDDTL